MLLLLLVTSQVNRVSNLALGELYLVLFLGLLLKVDTVDHDQVSYSPVLLMPRSVSTNRTFRCVQLFCLTGISMFIIINFVVFIDTLGECRHTTGTSCP